MSEGKVTRADIEAKFRELQSEVVGAADGAKDRAKALAAAGVVVVLVTVYLLGRKAGRKRSTVVEIRRL